MKSVKTSAILFLILVSSFVQSVALAKIEAVLGALPLKDNPNLATLFPVTNDSEVVLSRKQYLISYNKNRRNPNWVAWKLEQQDLGTSGRSSRFYQDQELESYLSQSGSKHAVTPSEYTKSCFDRGHQIPSADRTSESEDNQMTFVMSNMVPQTAALNRGVWKNLEGYARQLAKAGKKIYIIAGPIYDINFGAIGPNTDIQIPSKNFKILIVLEGNQEPKDINASTEVIAVMMPNTLADGSPPNTEGPCDTTIPKGSLNDWQKYRTSLTEIERLSGVTFNIQ